MKNILFIVCMTLAVSVIARPVSYPGGFTFMQMNDMDMSSIHIHYSPSIHYSIGYRGENWRDQEWQFHGIQLNYLLKRWNRPASQANFYFKSAAGIAHSDQADSNDSTEFAGFSGLAIDWEDRRYFTSYENRYTESGDIGHFFSQKARVGIAPYIGDYGDLHTWFMLQVDHTPKKQDQTSITPLVRFFKSEYLVELGLSNDGDAFSNLIVRF